MDQYPEYLIFATEEEVQARLNRPRLSKNQQMLNRCDGLQIEEIDGEPMAVVDVEVYQYLVKHLIDTVQNESNKE